MFSKALAHLITYMPAKVILSIVTMIMIPVITRIFSTSEYGYYTITLSLATLISSFCMGWLSSSVVRFMPETKDSFSRDMLIRCVTKWAIFTLIIVSLLLALILAFGVFSFKSGALYFVITGFVLILSISFFNLLLSIFRAEQKPSTYSLFSLIVGVGTYILGLLLIWKFKVSIISFLWSLIFLQAIAIPILFNQLHLKEKSLNNVWKIKPFISYGVPASGIAIMTMLLSNLDIFMISRMMSIESAGIYAPAFQLSEKTIMFIASLMILAITPINFESWEKLSLDENRLLLSQTCSFYLLLSLPVTIFIIFFSKKITMSMFHPDFWSGSELMPFIAFGAFCMGLVHRYSIILSIYKKNSLLLILCVFAVIFKFVFNYIYIDIIGLRSPAISTSLSFLFLLALCIFASKRFFSWQFPIIFFIKAIFSSVVAASVVSFTFSTNDPTLLNLCLSVISFMFLYFGQIFLFERNSEIFKPLKINTK